MSRPHFNQGESMEIKTVGRSKANKADPEKVKQRLSELRKEHSKMVKGKFEFLDAQGGWLEFTYRFFPEDILATYKFMHGEICEIPMGLVKHLNNTTKKIRKFGLDNGAERGNMLPDRGLPSTYEIQSRVRFTPLEVL